MDPTKLLKKQHREVKSFFRQVEKTEDANARRRLIRQILEALQLHMELEEKIFYPAVKQIGTRTAKDVALEAYEEHGVAKLVMRQLPAVDPKDERFKAKMTVFKELIEHHIGEEEQEMFKVAEKIGAQELDSLGDRMMAVVAKVGGEDGRPPRGGRSTRRP